MKLNIIIVALSLFFSGILSGQTSATITDVDFRIENNLIVVNYSIIGAQNNELFEIGLKFIPESGQALIPISVSGDIGQNINGGFNKTIFWDIDKDNLEISGVVRASVSIISSHIFVSEPYIDTRQSVMEKPLGGPGYAFLSFFVPTLGGYFVEKNKTRPIIFSVTEATIAGYLISLNNKKKQYETDLDNALTQTARNEIRDNISTVEDRYYNSMATFGMIWAVDVIWVAVKGARNMKQGKTKATQKNLYGDGFNLNYNGNQFCLGYHITF